MAFRELSVIVIREILRRWQAREGLRTIAAATGTDRKTVRRYVDAAIARGLQRESGRALDDELVGQVVADVLPGAPPRVGEMRALCREHRDRISAWVDEGCLAPKIARLLQSHVGVVVPVRTLSRFIAEELPQRRPKGTVRLVEPPAGEVLEIDFMEVGTVDIGGEPTKLNALVCVAAFSRHAFVWPCLGMTLDDVIAGLEGAWAFFGGVFRVVIADNPKPIVTRADPLKPALNEGFAEYAQSRGFLVDLARVRRPQDKPKVERTVAYTRSSAFAGERFVDLAHARRHAEGWCRDVAGQRIHGKTRRKPFETFEDERPKLLPAPEAPYDPPTWVELKVGRDHAVTVAGALYSVPHAYRERTLRVRFDRSTVKFYDRGAVVKVHPRAAVGASVIDPADLPEGLGELATRDAEGLNARAAKHGVAVGDYARRVLEGPLPWTRARHVHRLLGLCRTHGNAAVEEACKRALDLEVVDVTRVQRLLERSIPSSPPPPPQRAATAPTSSRFSRDPSEFRLTPRDTPDAT
jgi:transposase